MLHRFLPLFLLFAAQVLHAQWQKLPVIPAAGSADRISFPTADIGYLAASNGHIWKTTDAGNSWEKSYEIGELTGFEIYVFNDLHFTDAQHGFAVGYDLFGADYLILRTTDGGNSWSPYTYEYGFNIGDCWALDFVDNQTGYVVGDWGLVFKTTNGGATWSANSAPVNTRLWDVDFVTAQLGWALSAAGDLLKTTNGAASWQVQPTPVGFSRIQFLDADFGFAVGDSRFFKTTNGGQTWLPVGEPLPSSPPEFQFLDPFTGFTFIGDRPVITTDGGQNWLYQQAAPALPPGDFEGFSDLSILDGNTGFLAGFQNNSGFVNTLMAKTDNGGGLALNLQLSTTTITCPGNEPVTATPQVLGTPDTLTWFLNGIPQALPPTPQVFTGPWLSSENNTVKIRASAGNNVVEAERSFYVNYQPTTADYAWVTFSTQYPGCHGQSVQVLTNYGFSEQLQLRQGNDIVAGPFSVNVTPWGNFFQSPPLFDTSNVFTVEVLALCGPVVIGEMVLPAYPPINLSPQLTTVADPVLCQAGNVIEVQVENTLTNNGYQLLRNNNPEPFSFQNGNGGTISFTTSAFDSTSLFSVMVFSENNCLGFLDDSLLVQVERPSARFGTSGLNFEVGTPVAIHFAGQEAATYQWDFGQNATPASFGQQNPPPINYAGETATQIQLVVEAPLGCRDTFVQNIGLYEPGNFNEFWAQEVNISHQPFLILGQNMEIDAFGNVFLDGSISNAVPSNFADAVLPSKAGTTGFLEKNQGAILKYDKFGVLKWFLAFSGNNYGIRDMEPDSLGNCYVPIGHGDYFIGSTDGKRRRVQGFNGSSLVKYDPSGRIRWVAEVKSCDWGGPSILDVELDGSGNLLVFGRYGSCIEFQAADSSQGISLSGVQECWLAKYSPDGQVLWAKPLQSANGTPYVYGHSLRLDPSGNVYVCGESTAAVAKFDPTGEFLWSVDAISQEIMVVRNLDVDEAGNAYLAGMFRSQVQFAGLPELDGGPPHHNSDYDLFVLKVSPTGQPLWIKGGIVSNDYSENTAIRYHKGTVYVYGSHGYGQLVYDNVNFFSQSERNAILLQVNASNGAYLAHRYFNTPNPDATVPETYGCFGRTLSVDTAGVLHLLGGVGYKTVFENDTLTMPNWLFVAKTAGLSVLDATVEHHPLLPWSAAVLPNPAAAATFLQLDLQRPEQLTAVLWGPLGQQVPLFQDKSLPAGLHQIPLSFAGDLPAGVYFVRVENAAGIGSSLKLVVN